MSGITLQLVSGYSQKLSVSTANVQSAVINQTSVNIYSSVDVYVAQGQNPNANVDGTDQFIPAGHWLMVSGITRGNKLSFKTASGTGVVHIS